MREALCRAFCGDLTLIDVPVGYAVSTTFLRDDGDAVGFYIVRDSQSTSRFRIEDDGTTIPFLEAGGVEFSTDTRSAAFTALLDTYQIAFDEDEMLLHTSVVSEAELPAAAMRFVAFMLRVGDFLLLTREKVASTFKEDAARLIRERIGDRAIVSEKVAVSANLADNIPDLLIKAQDRRPVAVFLGSSQQRVYEAILLQMQALYEANEDVAVIALLENDRVVTRDVLKRAMNRLETTLTFRGDETESVHRIARAAVGAGARTFH